MKKVILSSFFLLGAYSYAQVGVNTTTPQSTLDVTAKNTTGTTSNVDGLLVPRVDRQRAQSMAAVPTSTLIYVNSIATGTQTGTTINVDAIGYYYYDGTVWAKLTSSSSPSSSVNIYNTDGSLTGNRIVTQAANTLAFTGTAVNAFSVDDTSLSVDATNHRTGLGTAAPTAKLDVVGSTTSAPIRARAMEDTNSAVLATPSTSTPVMIDANGVMIQQYAPAKAFAASGDTYSVNKTVTVPSTNPVVAFTGITTGSIVTFKFVTNFAFGSGNSNLIFGELNYSIAMGWQVSTWSRSGTGAAPTITGSGTNTLTFNYGTGASNLVFSYDGAGNLTIARTSGGPAVGMSVNIWDGYKIRN